ncbi:AAA family ATPase [Microbacterium halotolerans]|uniref:AAA family ATPase n=1 Tax=Microbacterium halotolerans TaxID=246613 RepID=UPI000E6A9F02|nr:SMC family ATPase [Microbacterium halotolerans]
MRIRMIEIEGFGPFRDAQTVDLDRFAGDGIFLISGRTGAGKSSILDAICFALYGSTPRYSEGEKRLRSDYSEVGEPSHVVLEFEVGDGAWRIERSPEYERPAKRGGGTTTERASVHLFEHTDDGWRGIASKERQVAEHIREIVGMNSDQFQQVILLAQGRFARFLLAKNDERRTLLRSLFGTRRFENYEQALDERRRDAEAGVGAQTADLRALLDQVAEQVERALAVEDEPDAGDAAAEGGSRLDDLDGSDPDGEQRGDGVDGAGRGDAGDALVLDMESEAANGEAPNSDGDRGGAADADGADADGATGTRAPDESSEQDVLGPDDWSGRIDLLDRAAERAAERRAVRDAHVERTRDVSTHAEQVDDERRVTAERQQRREAARSRLAQLDAERGDIEAARAELAAARRADGVRTAIDAVAHADAEEKTAEEAARAARSEWTNARVEVHSREGGSPDDAPEPDEADEATPGADADESVLPTDEAEPEVLDAFSDELRGRIGAWNPLRERESELARDAADIEAKREELKAQDAQIAELEKRFLSLPNHITAARESRDAANKRADQAAAVDEHISALESQFAAARQADELAKTYAAADEAVRGAKQRLDATGKAVDELHRRRLAGYSSELAQQLTDGEPCTVCGSTEHPAPAEMADDHVTPEQIEQAEEVRSAASAAHESANDERQRASAALADAQQRSGGRSETEVNGDLLAARERRDEAQTAQRERDALDGQIAELERERESLGEERTTTAARRAELAGEIDAAQKRLADDSRAVAAARGSFSSVAERIGAAQRLASRARACAAAVRDASRASGTARVARAALDRALGDAEFDTTEAARNAMRDAAVVAGLDRRVREADTERAAAERTLAELAAFELPEAPVDRDETQRALASARDAFTRALDARSAAAQLADALADALERARTAHERIAEKAETAAVITRLADTVAGRPPNERRMNLETFVLAAELEEIVQAANLRLAAMSNNQYTLRHSDARAYRNAAAGLGIEVFDAHTGRARPPQSLSGGETFLASLALALGLAEVVTSRAGGIRLDTLFIDEGFGSLDGETLEVAMRTLDDLRQGGRTVGLISHVEQMKEQIPAQLHVEQTPQGWSVVRQE